MIVFLSKKKYLKQALTNLKRLGAVYHQEFRERLLQRKCRSKARQLLIGYSVKPSSVQSLSHVQLFVTPWTAAYQASWSIINSQSLLKLMSIESVMPSNHLILCCSLLLLPSIFPSIRVFSNESGGQSIGVSAVCDCLSLGFSLRIFKHLQAQVWVCLCRPHSTKATLFLVASFCFSQVTYQLLVFATVSEVLIQVQQEVFAMAQTLPGLANM